MSFTFASLPTIHTSRLTLRSWQESDLAKFADLNADPEVMKYFPSTVSKEKSNSWVEKLQHRIKADGVGLHALTLKDTGDFIGFVGLAEVKFEASFTPCVEIGWRLNKQVWGKGLATEAAHAALGFGFNTIGLDEIVSFAPKINLPSINVMKKIGMHHHKKDDFDHPLLHTHPKLQKCALYKMSNAQFNIPHN
jgi:3-dehydroquinate dehydratase/shikimate dehydrogenase